MYSLYYIIDTDNEYDPTLLTLAHISQTSLLIERLRATLAEANWARAGLGMPISAEYDRPVKPPPAVVAALTASAPAVTHQTPAVVAAGNYR